MPSARPRAQAPPPAEPTTDGAFRGFGPQTLPFFKALAFHQSREWFQENRSIYDAEVKVPMEALVADLAGRFAARGIPLTADPAKAMFRLHRDTRFSREKHPYKTQAGAVLSRDGSKRSPGLLYIHLDPQGCFLGCGFWQPEPDQLQAMRTRIRAEPRVWGRILDELGRKGLELGREDAMKRLPRGFEDMKGTPHEVSFLLRNLITSRPVAAPLIHERTFVDTIDGFAADALPLLRFGWQALDGGA